MNCLKCCKREDGAALVIVLVTMAVLVVLATSLMDFSTQNVVEAVNKEQKTVARSMAEAGVAQALKELKGTPVLNTTLTGTLDSRNYTWRIEPQTGNTSRIIATGTSESFGDTWTAKMEALVEAAFDLNAWEYSVYTQGKLDACCGNIDTPWKEDATYLPNISLVGTPTITLEDGDTLWLNTLPPNAKFYIKCDGFLTLKSSTPNGAYGIIEADSIKCTGGTTLGQPDNPVVVYLTGASESKFTGNNTVYGLEYSLNGTIKHCGNDLVTGAIISKGDVTVNGGSEVHKFTSVLKQALINANLIASSQPTIKSWQETYSKS